MRRWRAGWVPAVLGGAAWWALVAALATYGLAQVAVRTEWFRLRVQEELSKAVGMEMRVGRIRATETLNLKIRDVISVSGDHGLELRLVRVRWRIFRPRGEPRIESVRVDGWAATLAPDEAGVLQPAAVGKNAGRAFAWAGIGTGGSAAPKMAGEGERMESPMRLQGLPRLEMRWGTVRMQNAAGEVRATVAGLDLLWTTMRPPEGGRISHLDVRAAEVRIANGPRIAGLHVEWIDAGTKQFLAVLEAADWGTAAAPDTKEQEYRALLDAMDD